MKRTDVVLLVAAGLATACTKDNTSQDQSAVLNCTSGPNCFTVADAPDVDAACPKTRQITVVAGAVCPSRAPLWSKSKVFPGAPGGELARYCAYDWVPTGFGPSTAHITGLPGEPAADCNVVGAMGTEWEQANAALYQAAYAEQVEARANLPTTTTLEATKLLIVDSSPNGPFPEPQAGQLEHGRVMGELGRHLGCPQGPGNNCRVDVATVLALGLERDPVTSELVGNSAQGGYLGSLTHTAVAIRNAVDYGLSTPGSSNLVINLSLGWDAHWGGQIPTSGDWTDLPAPVRAVYSALTYASCEGAIVVAAAGNSTGGPSSSSGAIFPAQWETEAAPGTLRCTDLGGQTPSTAGLYRPLLYAVGGVDGKDGTLLLEREGSRPRLVAPANHLAIERVGEPHSGVHSGTSVAAAAVSGIAATVWSYLPTYSNHEIMDIVFSEAVPVSHSVDFCNTQYGPCPTETRRASLCLAVSEACAVGQNCTSSAPACAPSVPGANMGVTNLNLSSPVPTIVELAPLSGVTVGDPCNATVLTSSVSALDNPCPGSQFHSRYEVPHLVPQPIVTGCPSCVIAGGPASLLLGISDEAPDVLSDAKLIVVIDGEKEILDLYELEEHGEDLRGEYFKFVDLPFDADEVESASIEFLVDHEYVAAEPLSVEY